jgi:hypothetical protein
MMLLFMEALAHIGYCLHRLVSAILITVKLTALVHKVA